MSLVAISRELSAKVETLSFGPPVTHVYNPLSYANKPHEAYLRRYGAGPKEVVLVGMNPGPFGMAQTGVPFGDVALVRDWMQISGPVERPDPEHPKRRIEGFACGRSEVSGSRLWGWARDRFTTPEQFFARFFVVNYCPLAFIEPPVKNRTPDKLPVHEREPLFELCDEALRATVAELRPRHVVGVGAFAERRARAALSDQGIPIGVILHPSPASPRANRGWVPEAEKELRAIGIELP
jgi:single-strand selective monofunctional uracil DNA glycosylase